MRKAKVATVQMDCQPLNREGNLEKALKFVRDAKKMDAELAVLPHMFATGYNVIIHPSRVAEDIEGSTVSYLKTISKKLKIHVVGGFVEKCDKDYFDTTVVTNTKGEIIGSYRRISLWQDEINDLSRGEDLCIVDTPIGRAGILVSRDFTFPEIARSLAFEGAELILISGALDDHAYWEVFCRARAIENACFVVASNRVGVERELSYCGHSMILDPEGRVLSDSESKEEARVAELDPKIMDIEREEYWQLVELEESIGIAEGEYLSEPMSCRSKVSDELCAEKKPAKKKPSSKKAGKKK